MTLMRGRAPYETCRLACALALAAFLLAPCDATDNALAFLCKDKNGKPVSGNGPPSNDCASHVCTLSNTGKKCEDESEPESAQKAPGDQAASHHKQWLSDIALLERYPTLERIEEARQADLDPVYRRLALAKDAMNAAVDERQGELQKELEVYPHGDVPIELAERLKSNALEQEQARQAIAQGKVEVQKIDAKCDELVKRFRTLKKAQK